MVDQSDMSTKPLKGALSISATWKEKTGEKDNEFL